MCIIILAVVLVEAPSMFYVMVASMHLRGAITCKCMFNESALESFSFVVLVSLVV